MIKNKKLILGTAILFSVLFVLSATFAWFTSNDEVKNRLQTARLTDGDVSIIETFDPDDRLEPGVALIKQAGAINTGETDAFVRMSFEEALTKLESATPVRNASKFTSSSTHIPQLVDISAYPLGAGNWTVLEGNSFDLTDDSEAFADLPAGITVVFKETATNPSKYSFAAYADLGDGQYQRVEVLPEAFNIVDGELKITLDNGLTGTDKVDYFNFMTLKLETVAPENWTATPVNPATFAALTEGPFTSANAATAFSSDYIQLIFGDNVKTSLVGIDEGDWFYNVNDGWFYYMGKVLSGTSTTNLLEKVYMMQEADSEYSYSTFDLTVKMEAIQALEDAVKSTTWGLDAADDADLIAQLITYC